MKPAEAKTVDEFKEKQMSITELEAQVQLAKMSGFKWLEVPKETLIMINRGQYPDTHYICYKDIKVAADGMAKQCQATERVTAHETIFPNQRAKSVVKE